MQKIDAPVPNGLSNLGEILVIIKNFITYGGIIAAVIVIIISGARYVFSQGDPKAISSAQRAITMAIIGVIVILLANIIVNFGINALVK